MALADLLAQRKSSSASALERPSESPAVAGGEIQESEPLVTEESLAGVPGDNQQEGLSSVDDSSTSLEQPSTGAVPMEVSPSLASGSEGSSSEAVEGQEGRPRKGVGGVEDTADRVDGTTSLDSSGEPGVSGVQESGSGAVPANASDEPVAKGGTTGETSKSEESEPYGVKTQTYGDIEIYYQAGPKRLYRVNGKQVVSVSEVLDILEKGGLPWWGMKIGVAGVLELVERGLVKWYNGQLALPGHDGEAATLVPATVERIVGNKELGIKGLLTEQRLTVNHVRDEAGDRGTNVHTALELWAEKGVPPQPAVYAPEEQGYVEGLRQFLVDSGAEAVRSEVMVGSLRHKYAGRYDLEAAIPKNAKVIIKTFPKSKAIVARDFPGGLFLLDLKTSKDVYDTHFIQLEAYENGRLECGLEPTDYRGVIHVTADGRYELRLNLQRFGNVAGPDKYQPKFDGGKPLVTFTDFKHVMAAAKALERIKGRK